MSATAASSASISASASGSSPHTAGASSTVMGSTVMGSTDMPGGTLDGRGELRKRARAAERSEAQRGDASVAAGRGGSRSGGSTRGNRGGSRLFGVSLATLAKQRALPPPFLSEVSLYTLHFYILLPSSRLLSHHHANSSRIQ